MSEAFRALRLTKSDEGLSSEFVDMTTDELMEGDVTINVSHSTVNYKDGLAITGAAPVARISPIIPGIDFAGVVETSSHADFKTGDDVILNGFG
ncbi:MAG: alcohol dehydrogenase catalytic domain-containing protein, partial [Alphaproteobacteria bacterium]|nr:alcohol dehydrogenase catalytic domain-containing protein [Alphaproteobacteria bacterium]